MTVDKNQLTRLFNEFISDYGINDRFLYDFKGNQFLACVQEAKCRVPHDDQTLIKGFGENEILS